MIYTAGGSPTGRWPAGRWALALAAWPWAAAQSAGEPHSDLLKQSGSDDAFIRDQARLMTHRRFLRRPRLQCGQTM